MPYECYIFLVFYTNIYVYTEYTEPSVESVRYLLLSGLPDTVTADNVEAYLSNSFDKVNDVVLLGNGTARAEVADDNESEIIIIIINFVCGLQKATFHA